MTTPSPICAEALSDKELEVLRLLAAGHTVKSIAARLDRSEASINERLREARRKTGVGSSRELARRLAAQKIWDRKSDLSPGAPLAEHPLVPRSKGFEWTKGKIAMAFMLPAAALGLALVAGTITMPEAAETAQAAATPLAGRWSLDVARLPENERPLAVTITFTPQVDGRLHTLVWVENRDGAKIKAESTAALDGVAVPVGGSMAEIDSVALRQPEPDTLVMTLAKEGQRVSTRVYTVAKDGSSMTETIVWANGEMPEPKAIVFNRIG
ncbi:DNA-binding CsgD family transcriptional regulator [Erythromicrobium ramosum]|uniref:DNA-binding CsgD family transcriptional regulator n=1 Tax=Erythrobacter ramosus TaxID=35811 RepID=A0A6I4UGF7_9SPHN|nr:helix-turn-helix transcriptional regulator [Erythrobacter ramosus]MBB3774782.1 DNA-binding CsgD family transcriptional regulator [Erythrobacter ramosus]MXP37576.1 helix-turn-helix transcriptional regulator [Erythrobacter ramosus]